jgi:hypothetical protein
MWHSGFFIPLGMPTLITVVGSVVFFSVKDVPDMLWNRGVFEPIDRHLIGKLADSWQECAELVVVRKILEDILDKIIFHVSKRQVWTC